ncbi:MAG TPA: fused isobutyryl-CoA mutase/GTPase IcmF [Acidimicrobiales bacterium]|nr:fused isobutyryl-CoA mutase/GTPase IcmF [Acidimicrobiales bacterium]
MEPDHELHHELDHELHHPRHPVRMVTAAALFDGHDAAINIMRRVLQSQGAEVVHLGHNRSVADIVTAAVQEDVAGVAVSSYQGGHMEFFTYLLDALRAAGAGHVRVYGGGGGVIVPAEVEELHRRGVARIFTPEDGQRLGLPAMVNVMVAECDVDLAEPPATLAPLWDGDHRVLARVVTCLQEGTLPGSQRRELRETAARRHVPVLGVTGTGGSGKSSLTDELVRRVRLDTEDKVRVAVVAVDPTRRRSGGALLGDRIRMNAIAAGAGASGVPVYFRSLATRGAAEVPDCLADVIAACKAAGHDLVIVETPGIGQGDAGIVPFVDVPVYVMTPEYGAASQLEKIDMLDMADAVVVNKFERPAGEDAVREVRKAVQRNRAAFGTATDELPVFGTIAARFNDDGVTALYGYLRGRLGLPSAGVLPPVEGRVSHGRQSVVPRGRERYLAEIAEAVRAYHRTTEADAAAARRHQQLAAAAEVVSAASRDELDGLAAQAAGEVSAPSRELLAAWPSVATSYAGRTRASLSGTEVPRVALPRYGDDGDRLRWLRDEHLPGHFPFTGGVFPFKRDDEDPTRMFAGEGDPARTNRRFHLLAEGQPATRLSTAFDSVTLYGADPAPRPDIYGKVGNSGVSVATLDDMRDLYAGFDLCDPSTSVSMTINGPAPVVLAMYLNTAIDQQLERLGHAPTPEEREAVRERVLRTVRGTVQADILKEDQGQNTCIFSTDFALHLMTDVQEWFVAHDVRNFYAVSISGYHIAEAGADPVTQLAFTLANGFTYVEAYLARGMTVDQFAPNLSFFFSNGMDPEYSVIGRVARRVWAIAMRDRYGGGERAQKLKYHVQTSGRSLHAQEMAFNDIRTTLQALCAVYDNCNSLHTNAYDEAVTTPSEDSVRRAMAIQLIINREWGLAMNDNPLQGSFVIEELTDLVEAAVLEEFDRLAQRGGVLGAMELGYQRGQIQDQSLRYETRKHDGSLPIVGVNTFQHPGAGPVAAALPLSRSTEEEKQGQLRRLEDFMRRHADERGPALDRLRDAALRGDNLFDVLMGAVRCCTLGEITSALFEIGGQYRRNV